MFKVTRSDKPEDWENTNYRDSAVVKQLKRDFFSKCYICEMKDFGNVNIEHFVPHLNQDEALKIEWENLYYACSHCNGIKGARHRELLDCCSKDYNISDKIEYYPPVVPNGAVTIKNACSPELEIHALTEKTIALLNQCYNNSNNGPQNVSHSTLILEIHKEYGYLWQIRFELLTNKDRYTEFELNQAIEKIINMTKPNYPFSGFWRTFIKNDPDLLEILSDNDIQY